ncbi:deoxyhypusine synthase family protein [Mucisphaera sp.]|uniref:deoxyhypusine synthase family protein n=1 Tax=Mucisphaera sp. TaxID=2913024 RepID=UPI003D0F44F0
MEDNFFHFNSRELMQAAKAYEVHINQGGRMFVTLAGAMSTARLGRILARMIRAGKIHGICCTGANLEEDLFLLLAGNDYEMCSDYRDLGTQQEADLLNRGMNRVTDICIPEHAMRTLERSLIRRWITADEKGQSFFPHEYLYDIIRSGELEGDYQMDPNDSWVIAAAEHDLPIYTPGWEDSTTGNFFTALRMKGQIESHRAVRSGTEQMEHLANWYRENAAPQPGIGFFQVGGGIAGDFPICTVPMLVQDLKEEDTPLWGYFCQISDAVTSYGGYSGAVPNEKITWGKLAPETPKFMIQSDATIVAPLIFAYVLGD